VKTVVMFNPSRLPSLAINAPAKAPFVDPVDGSIRPESHESNILSPLVDLSSPPGSSFEFASVLAPHNKGSDATLMLDQPLPLTMPSLLSAPFDLAAGTHPLHTDPRWLGGMISYAESQSGQVTHSIANEYIPLSPPTFARKQEGNTFAHRDQNAVRKFSNCGFPNHSLCTIDRHDTHSPNQCQGGAKAQANGNLLESENAIQAHPNNILGASQHSMLVEFIGDDESVELEYDLCSIASALFDEHATNDKPSVILPPDRFPGNSNMNPDAFPCDLAPLLSSDKLVGLMEDSRKSQEVLQEWDEKNGLPRSHSWTMMHTNRSRRQLLEGRILPKWNGAPLISGRKTSLKERRLRRRRDARVTKKPQRGVPAIESDAMRCRLW
jgi:hypothetical protein